MLQPLSRVDGNLGYIGGLGKLERWRENGGNGQDRYNEENGGNRRNG